MKNGIKAHCDTLCPLRTMDDLVAIVFIENETGDSMNTATKKRIHHADLNCDEGEDSNIGELTGDTLARFIIADYDGDVTAQTTTIATGNRDIYLVEIYDSNVGYYRSLKHHDLLHKDVIKLFGSRLRVRLARSQQQCQQQPQPNLLAIEGRFYPYDGGIEMKGIRIDVEEQTNDPNQGTAGNIWDGALLL